MIVSIKTAIIDYKSQTETEQIDLYKAIETIVLSRELELTEGELCSTFYMFDEVEDFEVYKNLKKNLFSAPLSLKNLAKVEVRQRLRMLDTETVEQLKVLTEPLQKFLFFEDA